MVRLEVAYNVPKEAVLDLIARIRNYLTPQHEDTFVATDCELEKARQKLTAKLDPFNPLRVDHLSWDYAAQFAKDLGLFPLRTRDEVDNLNIERYALSSMVRGSRSYTLEIFVGEKICCYPMLVRMDSNFEGFINDEVYLLESWYALFQKQGADKIDNLISSLKAKRYEIDSIYGSGASFLAKLPRTKEEFELRIGEARDRSTMVMLPCAVNMVRFYWDFFARPIQQAGFSPTNVTVKGPSFRFLLSGEDIEIIVQYPTLPQEEVIRKIFPKHSETNLQTSKN